VDADPVQLVQHNQNRLFDARILFRIGKGLSIALALRAPVIFAEIVTPAGILGPSSGYYD
jgi:hypothetical protein